MTDQQELDFDPMPQNFADCPLAGIHRDKSFEQYASWRAVNSGVVKWGLVSPKHFAAALHGLIKSEDTKDRLLGRACHCKLLEPSEFAERFVVAGKCEGVIKSGTSKGLTCGAAGRFLIGGQWFCGRHGESDLQGDFEVLTEDQSRRVDGVVESMKKLPPEIRPMLSRPGWNEVSITWEHKGLTMKGRIDRYSDGKRPLIIDVKKCQVGKGSREDCQRAILNWSYHVQAAIYVKGVESLTGKRPEFVWLFHEDNNPFDLQVIPASDEDIDIGWRASQRAIQNYLDSAPDHWGYIRSVENIHEGGLPAWFIQQEREKYAGI
jgi:hypothetical protein